jgi:predicted AAA+ superfamily ATPase
MVASHLLKYCHYLTDTGHGEYELRYLKNKEKYEIDFLILKNKKPWLPIEVKLNDEKPSRNWATFMKQLKLQNGIQLILKSNKYQIYEFDIYKILVMSAAKFFQLLI